MQEIETLLSLGSRYLTALRTYMLKPPKNFREGLESHQVPLIKLEISSFHYDEWSTILSNLRKSLLLAGPQVYPSVCSIPSSLTIYVLKFEYTAATISFNSIYRQLLNPTI
jgi:hypothetical protein